MFDKVFGDLVYDGGWKKSETITIWGSLKEVNVIVYADESVSPNIDQQSAYKKLKADINTISAGTKKKVKEYISAIEEDVVLYTESTSIPNDINELVTINEIVFLENGSFAFMCSASWDTHGLAVLCTKDDIVVGPQDIVWFES